MLSSVSKAFSSTKVAVSEAIAATKLSAKIAEVAEKGDPPADVCELKEVILNSEKPENVAKETDVKNISKEPEACPVKPKPSLKEMSEKLNKLNVKLPVWQIKISDFLQKVQDYVNTKIQKK